MGFFDSSEEKARRRELKEEAADYRSDAKNYISDAKDYIDDYKYYKENSRYFANLIEDNLRDYNKQKVEILKELGGEISGTIENFKRYNISTHIPKAPSISSAPDIPTFTVSNFVSAIPGSDFSILNIVLSTFSNPEKDRDEARQQMKKAERYANKALNALNQMKAVSKALENSLNYIKSERDTVNELMKKLRSLMQQLNDAMQQKSHTEESARQMEGICKIAEQIKGTLENQVMNNVGEIEENYKLYSQRIREINRSIPAAPNISDSSSWLDVVLKY